MRRLCNEIVAHRGLHDSLPENSLAAMLAAWHAGIVWCECDVHLSTDGVAVVIHDPTLERTTTGHGRVKDFSAAQLSELRLLDADRAPTEYRLPLLDELLAQCGPERRLLVEVKPSVRDAIAPIARKIHEKRGMLQSFHLQDMLIAAGQGCAVAVLLEECDKAVDCDFAGSIHARHESMHAARKDGRRVAGAWTVNDPEAIRRVATMDEISMIITDVPLLARQITGAATNGK